MTSFADTSLLMGNQKFHPMAGWYKASSQLEDWAVFCTMFLGDDGTHLATYEMFLLLAETSWVSPRLRAKAYHQPTSITSLLLLIQKEFNEIFQQALERRQMVRRPNFESLRRALVNGNFRPELVTLPGGLEHPERPLPPPLATRYLEATPPVAVNTPTTQP